MIFDVNTIATDQDLADEFGGMAKLLSAKSDVAIRDQFRASALADVLKALKQRTPPILETSLSAPSELKEAVVYRALSKICSSSLTSEGDRHQVLAKNYQNEYLGAIRGSFSQYANGGVRADTGGSSFSIRRR